MGIQYTLYSGRPVGSNSPTMLPSHDVDFSDIRDVVEAIPEAIVGGTLLGGAIRHVVHHPMTECDRLKRRQRFWNNVIGAMAGASLPAMATDYIVQRSPHAKGLPFWQSWRAVTLSFATLIPLTGMAAIFLSQKAQTDYMTRCVNIHTRSSLSEDQSLYFVGLPDALNPTAVELTHTMFTPSGRPYVIDWHAAGQAALIVGGAVLVVAAVVATDGAALAVIPAL